MWWEAMPTLVIISGCLSFPFIFNHYSNLFFLGTPHIRQVRTMNEAHTYLRDERLNGNPYKQHLLECINLEDEKGQEPEIKCKCP